VAVVAEAQLQAEVQQVAVMVETAHKTTQAVQEWLEQVQAVAEDSPHQIQEREVVVYVSFTYT
jgi:ABC-type hemin transport system substrate-binding protein